MSARETIAATLEAALPCKVIADVSELGELDPHFPWAIQLFRTKMRPAGRLGGFLEEYETWVLDPQLATDTALESKLDDHLDQLVVVLQSIKWLTWDEAARTKHPSNYHGYKLTLTAATQEQENPA